MSVDLVQVVNESAPYVVAAASVYGGAVLEKAQQEAADATVGVGRRLAQKIFGAREKDEPLPEALADVIVDPDDADVQAALRVQIRKALADDEHLVAAVREILAEASPQTQVHGGITKRCRRQHDWWKQHPDRFSRQRRQPRARVMCP